MCVKARVHVPDSMLTCVCVLVKDLARCVCLLRDVCVCVCFLHRLWGVWLLLCCQVGCCCLAWLRGSFNVHWSRISNCSQQQLSSVPVMGDAATWHPPVCCTGSLLATTHTCMHVHTSACTSMVVLNWFCLRIWILQRSTKITSSTTKMSLI